MITLKHRLASGVVSSLWEFGPCKSIFVLHGQSIIEVPVASERNPRSFAFALSRKSEHVWQLAPSRFVKQGHVWTCQAHPFDSEGRLAEFLLLTHAPDGVSAELAKL